MGNFFRLRGISRWPWLRRWFGCLGVHSSSTVVQITLGVRSSYMKLLYKRGYPWEFKKKRITRVTIGIETLSYEESYLKATLKIPFFSSVYVQWLREVLVDWFKLFLIAWLSNVEPVAYEDEWSFFLLDFCAPYSKMGISSRWKVNSTDLLNV